MPKLTVITQNIDDLHERAGSTDVIHLHGSLHQPRCFACARPHGPEPSTSDEPEEGRKIEPPVCTHCGGRVRPGVVWFGEQLASAAWAAAVHAIEQLKCDVFFSIGTSALVYPAAELPMKALQRGAVVIQINPDVTTMDKFATYNLRGTAASLLDELVKMAWPD